MTLQKRVNFAHVFSITNDHKVTLTVRDVIGGDRYNEISR